jgi:hypothetical protein
VPVVASAETSLNCASGVSTTTPRSCANDGTLKKNTARHPAKHLAKNLASQNASPDFSHNFRGFSKALHKRVFQTFKISKFFMF